jgi:phosphoglycolate phosphatase-like HAD superfamily hydrolase
MNLAVFDLSSVVHYDAEPVRTCLVSAISEVLGRKPKLEGLNWKGNCSGVLLDIFMQSEQRFPTDVEYDKVKDRFTQCLKAYFIHSDENFEVMPGVQSLFDSLDKKSDWEYVIVSDYWGDNTDFLLTSCGIYTKSKAVHTADEALSSVDLINRLCYKYKLKPGKDTLYIISDRFKRRDVFFHKGSVQCILPPFTKKSKYTVYPKFSKVFST